MRPESARDVAVVESVTPVPSAAVASETAAAVTRGVQAVVTLAVTAARMIMTVELAARAKGLFSKAMI